VHPVPQGCRGEKLEEKGKGDCCHQGIEIQMEENWKEMIFNEKFNRIIFEQLDAKCFY
jgi:hypothetical protein